MECFRRLSVTLNDIADLGLFSIHRPGEFETLGFVHQRIAGLLTFLDDVSLAGALARSGRVL
jgi:hypothetical protein